MKLCFISLVTILVVVQSAKIQNKKQSDDGPVIYCYFESWTVYRPGNGKFDVDNIDPYLCTHIAFTFVGLQEDGSISILDPWESNSDGLDGFGRFVRLKDENPNLKTIISMGGWNEGSLKYSAVAADPLKRANLVASVINFLDKQGFDGFDLDWEYPARRDSTNPDDKQNYILLLNELKDALSPNGYILSVAVGAGKMDIDTSYDIPALTKTVDYLNVMSYDFHGAFDNYVGHHTLLYSNDMDIAYGNDDWNIDSGISYWLEQGADPSKINMGIATYARTFTLADVNNASLYAPIIGGGTAGPYTRQEGILGYNELCELHPNLPDIYDDVQKVYHKVYDNQWIGYESTDSIATKVEYALDKNIGGFMVWSFDTDDFSGLCGEGEYPLINSIKTTAAKYRKQKKNLNKV